MLRRIEHMQLTMTNFFFIQMTLTDLGTSQLAKECRVIKWYWRRLALDPIWIYRKEYNQWLFRHMQGAFQRMTTCNLYCKHQARFSFPDKCGVNSTIFYRNYWRLCLNIMNVGSHGDTSELKTVWSWGTRTLQNEHCPKISFLAKKKEKKAMKEICARKKNCVTSAQCSMPFMKNT